MLNESYLIRSIELPALAELIAAEVEKRMGVRSASSVAGLVDRVKLAELLGVSVPTIDRMVKSESIPSTTIRSRRVFDVESVRKAITASGD